MSKAEERALEAYPPKIDGDSRGSYDFNELNRIKYLQGYHQAMEDVVEWIDNHWREYVNVDADGVVCFGHWKNDLRKAMKDE